MIDKHRAPRKTIRILFIAAEADPLIKVGGLGDVGGSLPCALRNLSPQALGGTRLDIRLALPFHAGIDTQAFPVTHAASFVVGHTQGPIPAEAYLTHIDNLPAYLIKGHPVPDVGPVYSSDPEIDGRKFTFFSLGALELARALQWKPHILHANDWHTGMAVHYLELIRKADRFFAGTRSLLSLHNLPYMGAGTQDAVREFGLPPSDDPRLPEWAQHLPLPMALSAADRIVAVSPGYAEEIQTPGFGVGLEDFLIARKKVISGILNGLDTGTWNPAADKWIVQPFDGSSLDRRMWNKAALLETFSFPDTPKVPLLTLIGRMDPQKGVDLVLDGLKRVLHLPWQIIILGTGDPQLESAAQKLASDYPDRVRVVARFDSQLSHQLYAGADLLLMPSRYEPCGLAQMIAMRYGCVPLARKTGGLRDTIIPYRPAAVGTGFLFDDPTPKAFAACLEFALAVYKDFPRWQALQLRGMVQDFSWHRSAVDYAKIYQTLKEGSR